MINPYTTLAEFKQFATARGQTASTDPNDDANIQMIIENVSRYFDDATHRTFYPRYETRYFDVPILQNSPRNLFLDDDLLQEVSIINGDTQDLVTMSTSLGGKVYNLKPKNYYPKYAIQIIGPASIFWIFNGIGSVEKVIAVTGWWGFHNKYDQRGWTAIGTLSAAITDTTSTSFSLTAGHTLVPDKIVKIDNEIMNISTVQSLAIASSTNATPIEITTSTPHGLATGNQVVIANHLVNTNANGTWVITWVSTTKFTLTGSVGNGVGAATGTVLSNSVASNTFSVNQRGDNGSTAATHLVNAPVYVWNVQPEIKMATLMTVQSIYSERSGQPTSSGKVTVTAAGVVIRPEDIPSAAQAIVQSFTRIV
jgi:hypothetical protein